MSGPARLVGLHEHPLFDRKDGAWGPKVDAVIRREEEAHLGLRLPDALVSALSQSNGGRLRRTHLRGVHTSPRTRRGLQVRDLAGIGYAEGLRLSAALCAEWDYPEPALVLSSEGPSAVLLDYRRCGAEGSPAVIYVDTDHEVDGRPAEWTLALDVGRFLAALCYAPGRSQVAVPVGVDLPELEAALRAAGGSGTVNQDYEGGRSLALVDVPSREPGMARLRSVPLRRPDGTRWFPELSGHAWLVETAAVPAAARTLFEDLERRLGVPLTRLTP